MKRLLTISVLVLNVCTVASDGEGYDYTIKGIGNAGGPTTVAYGINNNGQVTGSFYPTINGNVTQHAFLYSGSVSDLALDSPNLTSDGHGINASGHVTGVSGSNAGSIAFIYDGSMKSIAGAEAGLSINDFDQVTGYLNSSTAFRTERSGAVTNLGTLAGGSHSSGTGINNNGLVTGSSDGVDPGTSKPFPSHAFLYDGTLRDLKTLGGLSSTGYAVNDGGLVVGEADNTQSQPRAFLYDGKMNDLGSLSGIHGYSRAYSINKNGDVVGSSSSSGNGNRAFVWKKDVGIVDLNNLLFPGTGWTLTNAVGINDRGLITGIGDGGDGYIQAFVLVPVVPGDVNQDGYLSPKEPAKYERVLTDQVGWVDPATYKPLTPEQRLAIGDADGDGKVTNADLQATLEKMKSGSGQVAAVPEPPAMQLVGTALAICCIARLRSNRRGNKLQERKTNGKCVRFVRTDEVRG